MSRRIFTTGDNKVVATGYDRPLDYCFLTVEDRTKDEDSDERTVFESMWDVNCFLWNADDVLDKLAELNVEVPSDLRERLYDHERRYAGNEVYVYE